MHSLKSPYNALVFGASGGIGSALCARLDEDDRCAGAIGVCRRRFPGFDLQTEDSIAHLAEHLKSGHDAFDLIIVATGVLTVGTQGPEKSIRHLDPEIMARSYWVNAIGPALILKHFWRFLPRGEKSVFVCLSARVGSIQDNGLGGWTSYRASKAALNQIVRTSAIEITRARPQAVCVAVHPGTVDTGLSRPYAGNLPTVTPALAAGRILDTVDRLTPDDSGGFFAYDGRPIPY